MAYLLSVDGGGTKTEFCISDLAETEKKSFLTGSTNFKSVGVKEARKNIKEGFQWVQEELGIRKEDIAFAVFGISGCDSEKDYDIIHEELVKGELPKERYLLCNDGVMGFYAQTDGAGIVLIAGTGSIAIGIDKNGKIYRSGGWGYNFSDAGSGYWIGCEAARETLRYCDGCREYAALFENIRKHFQAENFEKLPFAITGIQNNSEIAYLAKIVVDMAEAQEPESVQILQEGARLLADLAGSVYKRAGMQGETKISIVLSGGVLKSACYEAFLKKELERKIPKEQTQYFGQKNAPAYGGIKLAKRMLEKGV